MSKQTDQEVSQPKSGQTGRFKPLHYVLTAAIVVGAAVVPSWKADANKTEPEAETLDRLPVGVVKAKRESLAKEFTVQAEFRPYQEVDLHSKVAGFLEKINVDIGDHVKAGQELAVLEVPELQDDLKRAQAIEARSLQEVKRAESVYADAHVAYTRLAAVNKSKPNLIAQQDLDTAMEKDHQASSALAAARQQVEVVKAETAKLHTIATYSQIVAPFSGVITKRSADPGALIPAGTSSGAQSAPLLRVSQLDHLRLVFPVSMSYVSKVKVGTPVKVQVKNQEKKIVGKVARTSNKIESATRTMDVEMDIENPDLKLIPGMYAEATIELEKKEGTIALPVQAVARGAQSTIYVVNAKNEIDERHVQIGLETPTRLEILSGLKEGEQVMIGSRSQIKPGQKVEPKLVENDKEQHE